MVGAPDSPLSRFTGGGDAFQRGMMIGNTNSPFATVADAMMNVVNRYHQNIAAQQEQANSLERIKATGQSTLGNEKEIIDYKRKFAAQDPDQNGPQIIKDPTTGKFFYGNSTPDATTGVMKKSWTPVTNAPPTDEKKINENFIYRQINQGMGVPSENESPLPGVPSAPAPVVNANQGIGPNMEQAIQANMKHYGKSREEVVSQMKAKGMI